MINASDPPWKYLIMWLRIYFAIHYLKSGLYFVIFDYIPDFSKAGDVGAYLYEMNKIGFYPFVKYLEVILGALLLFNRFVPLVLIIMAGITVQISYLNLVVSPHPRQNFTGTQELLLNGSLLLAYGGYYADYLRSKVQPYFLWQGLKDRDQVSNNNV